MKRISPILWIISLIIIQSNFVLSADFELILLPDIKMESSQIETSDNLILISSRVKDTNFVYMSTNEGLDWEIILKEIKPAFYPIAPTITKMLVFDKNTFFMSYDAGIIKFTTNRGLEWNELKPDSSQDAIHDYSMFSYKGNMYLIYHYFSRLTSFGDFVNWSTFETPLEFIKEPYLIGNMQFLNDGNLKISIYDTVVNTWQHYNVDFNSNKKIQFLLKEDMHRFYFLNKDTGWCFFKPPHSLSKQYPDNWNTQIIYKTTDAGISWIKQLDTTIQRVVLQGINFINNEIGFAYGTGDVILFTDDGGNNWEYITENISDKFIGYITSFKIINHNTSLFKASDKLYLLKRKTTSVSEKSSSKLAIYPNPATDYITINIGRIGASSNENNIWASPNASIEIYDVMGVLVAQTSSSVFNGQTGTSDPLRIDISNLSPGVYFVKIGDRVEKFVKY